MNRTYKALCWAGAMLLNALGNYLGYIGDDTAQVMFAVLPALFILSLRDGGNCLPARKEA